MKIEFFSHSLYFIFVNKKNIDNDIKCAVDIAANDIKVHKKFDSSMKYHQMLFEEFCNKYGESITNSSQIIWEGKNMIITEKVQDIVHY